MKAKGTGNGRLPDPEQEPNFYEMLPLTPPISKDTFQGVTIVNNYINDLFDQDTRNNHSSNISVTMACPTVPVLQVNDRFYDNFLLNELIVNQHQTNMYIIQRM